MQAPILARSHPELLVKRAREMGGAVEAPGKGDLGQGVSGPGGIGHLPGALLEPPAQDIGAHLLASRGEDRPQISRRDLEAGRYRGRRKVRAAQVVRGVLDDILAPQIGRASWRGRLWGSGDVVRVVATGGYGEGW